MKVYNFVRKAGHYSIRHLLVGRFKLDLSGLERMQLLELVVVDVYRVNRVLRFNHYY